MVKTKMNNDKLLKQIDYYYSEKVRKHGATHWGVDWNSDESQNFRFDQLLKVTNGEYDSSVIDYGCGYGAMASYMRNLGYTGEYIGYDISQEMIKIAHKKQVDLPNCSFVFDETKLDKADYTIASGLFNVKQGVSDKRWLFYILETVNKIAKCSEKGFSFNILTIYSDKEKMRDDLFYADPRFFLDYCIRTYSRSVTILHGYGFYEFTVLVKLN